MCFEVGNEQSERLTFERSSTGKELKYKICVFRVCIKIVVLTFEGKCDILYSP
jgi:hypothetical protein